MGDTWHEQSHVGDTWHDESHVKPIERREISVNGGENRWRETKKKREKKKKENEKEESRRASSLDLWCFDGRNSSD